MDTILISLIGRGSVVAGRQGYRTALYNFDDGYVAQETAFFGSALYKYLKDKGQNITKWIIFGTSTSAWSEIIGAVDAQNQDRYVEIYDEVYNQEISGITDEKLNEWDEMLEYDIPGIHLIKVDALDYEAYINALLEYIPDDYQYNIIFDMTHAYRHMPILISFSLMYLKYFKNIQNIDVYYGALDMTNKEHRTPVLKIDFINKLFNMATSYESFKSSGYFPDILDSLGINDTKQVYFQMEMNRNPRGDLKEILNELEDLKNDENYIRYTAENIEKKISPLVTLNYLDERMLKRAKFFYERNQYLKALILMYEAILILAARKLGQTEYASHETREHVRRQIKNEIKFFEVSSINNKVIKEEWMKDIYNELEYTRNTAAHGTYSSGVQNLVERVDDYSKLFNQAERLYEFIRTSAG